MVSTTVHKTLAGPRSGLILAKEEFAKKIDSAVFPGQQGGPLEHVIAGKAVAFKLAATEEFAYRGVLLMALVRLLPACKVRAEGRVALALLLGSVAFAAAHDSLLTPDGSLAVSCQRGVAGLVLGFVALRSRSLLAPMFAHAAFNAVVLTPGFGR